MGKCHTSAGITGYFHRRTSTIGTNCFHVERKSGLIHNQIGAVDLYFERSARLRVPT